MQGMPRSLVVRLQNPLAGQGVLSLCRETRSFNETETDPERHLLADPVRCLRFNVMWPDLVSVDTYNS